MPVASTLRMCWGMTRRTQPLTSPAHTTTARATRPPDTSYRYVAVRDSEPGVSSPSLSSRNTRASATPWAGSPAG